MTIFRRGKNIVLFAIFVLICQMGSFNVYAGDAQTKNLVLHTLNPDEPAIGYNRFDGYYADVKWDALYLPLSSPYYFNTGYTKFYTREIPKPYKGGGARSFKEQIVVTNTDGEFKNEQHRLKNLKSGTIYYIDTTAYCDYNYDQGSNITKGTGPESTASNRIKVMTDINVDAYSIEDNKIKIIWDDVWNTDGRIDYKLYVSEDKSFSNTPPLYVRKGQIGGDGPIQVNQETGKLEYIYTARDPGRVYHIRIEPDVNDNELEKNQYSNIVSVSTFILVKTTKISNDSFGAVWRLDWTPVVTGLGDSDIKIVYHIYEGVVGSSELPKYVAEVSDVSFFVTVPPDGVENYFIIKALVTRGGHDVYEGIKIESQEITLKEQEIAFYPAMPEVVDKFLSENGDVIASYDQNLTPQEATIIWRAPLDGNGEMDENIVYDIWVIEDPDLIDNPPPEALRAQNLSIEKGAYISYDSKVIGHSYTVLELTPNSTYYFKIVAKRQFLEYVDDVLQGIMYQSDSAFKVIVTPPKGPIDQPLVPARPPLKVKKYADGRHAITEDSITIQLQNMWYEKFNTEKKQWEYIRTEKLDENDIPPFIPTDESGSNEGDGDDPIGDDGPEKIVIDGVHYRKVIYDPEIKIDVGCIEFVEGMSYDGIENIPADWVTNFSVNPNDPLENPLLSADGNKHNIDIKLTGLEANTAYVVWVRAVRPDMGLVSEASVPIVVTTDPIIIPPDEKPIVPFFNYSMPGDVYIDLGWEFNPGYSYYIKYGIEDNINSSIGTFEITQEEFNDSMYYRVGGLNPGTLYYFWLQAEAHPAGGAIASQWSDSYLVSTLDIVAPESPKGFGIKNSADAVTKNTITFEWMQDEGFGYILEISHDADFEDSIEYETGESSEYTIEGLISNHRYYARLYAYDPVKAMRSAATHTISVRTKSSSDDYDSNVDIEEVITGDFIDKADTVENGVWNIKITGINADRFIERVIKDNKLDVTIDLTDAPGTYEQLRLCISNRVFEGLTKLSENLTIKTEKFSFTIRPGTFPGNAYVFPANKEYETDYIINISHPKDIDTSAKNMVFKGEVFSIGIDLIDGGNVVPVSSLLRPLLVLREFKDEYKMGKTTGLWLNNRTKTWEELNTKYIIDHDRNKGSLMYGMIKMGDTIIGEPGYSYFDDVYYHKYEDSINNVASLYHLNSVSGRLFEPDNYVTLGQALKFLMDVLGFEYDSNFMKGASRAGFISTTGKEDPNKNCTAEEAYTMIVRLFELKTGKVLELQEKHEFIEKNGLYIMDDDKRPIANDKYIKRGEMLALIEKILVYTGELE